MIGSVETHQPNVVVGLQEVQALRGGLEVVDELADEWRTLCSEAVDDQPFYRPEFIRAHIYNVIPHATIYIITVRQRGRLRLVLPLVEELGSFLKVPVRKLRAPVNFNCGRFDAVCHASLEGDAALRAAWQYLKALDGWDLLQFRDALEGSTVGKLSDLARMNGFLTIEIPENPSPFVTVPSDPELLERLPPNAKLRSQLRQARRCLSEEGPLKFSRISDADYNALERFYQLEASGWKGLMGTDILHDGSRPFFDALAESAARFGYFSLYMLEVNDKLIAAHFSLTYRGRCYSPKVAFNEEYRQFAPGHLIISEILRDCSARGIYGYDITGQNQDWKMKWTTATLPVKHHFIFRGSLGRLAYAVHTSVERLRSTFS